MTRLNPTPAHAVQPARRVSKPNYDPSNQPSLYPDYWHKYMEEIDEQIANDTSRLVSRCSRGQILTMEV